jgi:hypothetical protein
MNFHIRRTSTGFAWDAKPCEEAFWGTYARVYRYPTDDPEDTRIYGDATKRHHENGEMIVEFEEEGWLVSVDGLEGLLTLAEKYGDLIVSKDKDDVPFIKIYDGYVE